MINRITILFFIFILSSCKEETKKQEFISICGEETMPQYDYRATLVGEMTPRMDSLLRIEKRRDIFKACRKVEYRATFYSENGELLSNETITTFSTGKRWKHQSEKQDELLIFYDYNPDSIEFLNTYQLNKEWVSTYRVTEVNTGIIENVEKVWVHPFRSNQYNFTQVAPFPQVELPLRIGKKWTDNDISLDQNFGDWANMKVRSSFEVIDREEVQTTFRNFKDAWKIKATSSFPLGESELTYWFDENYGFVMLEYINYGQQKLEVELVRVLDGQKVERG